MCKPEEWQQLLATPFRIDVIQQRPLVTKKDKTAAIPANYVDARTVMDRLDTVLGSFNWQLQYQEVKGVLYAGLAIRSPETSEWIWKWDAGTESTHEKAKGEASDAFKRASVKFGVGRHLYAIPARWVGGYRGRDGKFHYDQNALEEYRTWLAKFLGQTYEPIVPIKPSINDNDQMESTDAAQESASSPTEMQLVEAETLLEHPLFAHDRGDWVKQSTTAITEKSFEAFLGKLRREKQHRRTTQQKFRRQLERARDSFDGIGEGGKFTYQLRREFDTSSIDKVVAEHWLEGEALLQSLRTVFTQEKQAA